MHKGHTQEKKRKMVFFFCISVFIFIKFYSNKGRLKKYNIKKCKKGKEKLYTKKNRIEITLKEHPGRADLPVPHYSPEGRSSREMALSVGHWL